MFSLTKWYLDCVDQTGQSAIGYWTMLRWGRLAVAWQAVTLADRTGPPAQRSHASISPAGVQTARASEPAWAGGQLVWNSSALGCRLRYTPHCQPFGAHLLAGADGALEWRCEAAAASVSLDCDGRPPAHGTGYAERLVLTIPPWRLPIDELRWGRWIAHDGTRSVVWIDWRGQQPHTLVFLDGACVRDASVSDGQVVAGRSVLVLSDRQVLHERTVGEIIRPIRRLVGRLPGRWLALADRKWRSQGTLAADGTAPSLGWAIHEKIEWP